MTTEEPLTGYEMFSLTDFWMHKAKSGGKFLDNRLIWAKRRSRMIPKSEVCSIVKHFKGSFPLTFHYC